MARKPRKKPRPRVWRPGKNGGKLQSGSPKPQGGRPKDEFYEWLQGALYDKRVRLRVEALLHTSRDPELFLKTLKWADERLHGRPNQPLTTVNDDGDEIAFRLHLA